MRTTAKDFVRVGKGYGKGGVRVALVIIEGNGLESVAEKRRKGSAGKNDDIGARITATRVFPWMDFVEKTIVDPHFWCVTWPEEWDKRKQNGG